MEMKIAYCTMEQFDNREKNSVGSSRIRGRWVYENWHLEYPSDTCEKYLIGREYDAMIFQKVYWKQMMKEYKGIKILDLCDPDWLEGKDVMEYVRMSDYCTTSTPALAEYIQKFVDVPTVCVADRVDQKEHPKRGTHVGKAKKVVWFGYSHNFHYVYQTLEALRDFGLELHVVSPQIMTPPAGYGFTSLVNHTWSYPSVHDIIASCDIYISPERMDERGKFKSNNKELTCMTIGVPVARTEADLQRLLDPVERNKQMELDQKEIDDKWDIKYSVREMKGIIDEIQKDHQEKM